MAWKVKFGSVAWPEPLAVCHWARAVGRHERHAVEPLRLMQWHNDADAELLDCMGLAGNDKATSLSRTLDSSFIE